MFKRLIRKPFVQAAGAWALGQYLAFVYFTTRWRVIGAEHFPPIAAQGTALINCFWHERLPMMPMLWRIARRTAPSLAARGAHVLVSRHRDGVFIGEVVGRFDLKMVHASTSNGGSTGMRLLLRLLKDGEVVAITPDGPRGPRRQAAMGVAQLAVASGLPVVPSAAATTHHIRLKSWDRMMLPLPFGRGVVVVGAPIRAGRGEAEAALALIEASLNDCCDRADAALGIAAL